MSNTHFSGQKIPMFIVEFIDSFGKAKSVKFFNPQKAGSFYTHLMASSSITKVKKYKRLITAAEKRSELSILKNRKG